MKREWCTRPAYGAWLKTTIPLLKQNHHHLKKHLKILLYDDLETQSHLSLNASYSTAWNCCMYVCMYVFMKSQTSHHINLVCYNTYFKLLCFCIPPPPPSIHFQKRFSMITVKNKLHIKLYNQIASSLLVLKHKNSIISNLH